VQKGHGKRRNRSWAGQGREVTNLFQQACIKKAKYFREKRREMSDEKQ